MKENKNIIVFFMTCFNIIYKDICLHHVYKNVDDLLYNISFGTYYTLTC